MTKKNITFSEEELARMRANIEQEINERKEREAKIKDIYTQLFSKLSLVSKLECFVKTKPWVALTNKHFNDNRELMTELSINDVMDFNYYMSEFLISELKDNFTFIDLDFDKLDLSNEDAELWRESDMFMFTTGLWLVTVNNTDYIVHEMSGQGETLFDVNTVDNFIIDDNIAKENLSADNLNKFAEQFKEFALKCKN